MSLIFIVVSLVFIKTKWQHSQAPYLILFVFVTHLYDFNLKKTPKYNFQKRSQVIGLRLVWITVWCCIQGVLPFWCVCGARGLLWDDGNSSKTKSALCYTFLSTIESIPLSLCSFWDEVFCSFCQTKQRWYLVELTIVRSKLFWHFLCRICIIFHPDSLYGDKCGRCIVYASSIENNTFAVFPPSRIFSMWLF